MTVLRALVGHYDRLVESGPALHYGYSSQGVSYAVVLSPGGEIVDVMDVRDTTGKSPRPNRILVPGPVSRSANIAPNFLWDKTAYSLGLVRDDVTGEPMPAHRGEHDAFKQLHLDLLAAADDKGLRALASFLSAWNPEPEQFARLPHAQEMLDSNVVFRLQGEREYIHDRAVGRRIWQDHLETQGGTEALCLVTGELAPVERLHPKVKGVRGAQSSGASLISFNLDAFESFGRRQGGNAPVSERAAFAYTTALNAMLTPNSGNNIWIGDTTVVYWAEASLGDAAASAAESIFSILADPPPTDTAEGAKVRDKLAAVSEGRPIEEVQPDVREDTRFFVLGLAPNASRLSIRFWYEDRIGAIYSRIAEHWTDLRLEPLAWTGAPALWTLLIETAPPGKRRTDNIPPTLGGALMRAILTGGRYPQSLFAAVMARMRADKDINGRRVAICKACLARDHRLGFENEDVSMSLNPDDTNAAYRLGRLFAVYESLQRAALPGVNATIKDRYFGAASATPASVFPLLERNSANHLASLRKGEKARLAHWFDQQIDSILSGFDTAFPRSLRLQEQGRFAIGYHHQRAYRRTAGETAQADANAQEED